MNARPKRQVGGLRHHVEDASLSQLVSFPLRPVTPVEEHRAQQWAAGMVLAHYPDARRIVQRTALRDLLAALGLTHRIDTREPA